jgi:hypothetical protein
VDQIADWLDVHFDGVIACNEAHNMGNMEPEKDKSNTSKGGRQVMQWPTAAAGESATRCGQTVAKYTVRPGGHDQRAALPQR